MNKQRIIFDFSGVMADSIGYEHGLDESFISSWEEKCGEIVRTIKEKHSAGQYAFMDMPSYDTASIKEFAGKARGRFENFVTVGIGGSSLGAVALYHALKHPFRNLLRSTDDNRLKLFFADNVDPDFIKGMFDAAPPELTLYNIITKSGSTSETMGTFLVVKNLLEKAVGEAWKEHVVITTDPEKGDLRRLVRSESLTSFEVPEGIGGRFSVLSPVGLLPAACAGINIDRLLSGAGAMAERLAKAPVLQNPACIYGLIHYLLDTVKGKNITVMMPYSNALYSLADWFRQLWAESLGKKHALDGKIVHVGSTPVKALGVTDQHSQIQLYVEGPNDKVLTIISVKRFSNTVFFHADFQDYDSLSYFAGHTMNDLIAAECNGTLYTLRKSKRPAIRVIFPEITPYTVGQFIFAYELMTVFTGALYNINPLDQPGVEAGKVAAYSLMGRKGYKDRKEEILEGLKTIEKWVL